MQVSAEKCTPEPRQAKSPGFTIKTCPEHGDYQARVASFFGGKAYYTMCPKCEAERHAEELKIKAIEKGNKIAILKQNSQIPPRFQICMVSGFIPKTQEQKHALQISTSYVKNFPEISGKGSCLTFCGKPGTGKTHLACAIAMALINREIDVLYSTTYHALTSIKSTYNKKSEISEAEAIKTFIDPGLLIMDEVGVQFGTETEKILLYQIINGRYERILPTIIISNLTKEELTDYLGERCIDRLREGGGAVVPFVWESYRGNK